MESLFILREISIADNKFNAGSKAREDVDRILIEMKAQPIECGFDFSEDRSDFGKLKKIKYHFRTRDSWIRCLRSIPNGSIVVIQFPVIAHTVFFNAVLRTLKKRAIKTIAVVHDLETLRNSIYYGNNLHGFRLKLEEVNALKEFDVVVAHNERMKKKLSEKFNIKYEKIVSLEIFDYLVNEQIEINGKVNPQNMDTVVIAGNLDPIKCGYLCKLPKEPCFELYGANYKGGCANNVHYKGAFLPAELPTKMNGGYGLIWDGDDIFTCSGIFGEYLRINNPHKSSLYLASGIPVIIWKEAAMADFIQLNNCGVTVNSIEEIESILTEMTEEKYQILKENAENVGRKLREGFFTKKAIKESAFLINGGVSS